MLRLPAFTFLQPRSLDEAVEMLAERGDTAVAVAGGTDLYPKMKRRQLEPTTLVGLRGVGEIHGISSSRDVGLTIGAGETLTRVLEHPEVRRSHPALVLAAGSVSTLQLRTMGTIGGNLAVDTRCNYYDESQAWRQSLGFCLKKDGDICLLAPSSPRCWAVSSSDLAPVMVALGARLTLRGAGTERTIDAHDLYRDDGIDHLAKERGEIIAEIQLPPLDGQVSTYRKLRRRGSFDFPILGVAAALRIEGGVVAHARIVLGGVASWPVRARSAEELLVGNRPTPELVDAVAQRAGDPAKPLDNTDLVPMWRKRMSRVFVRRSLLELVGLSPEGT